MLNLRQVEYFVVSVDAGTMTAAADQLRVSQSAVSLAVAGLENTLGTQLLIRRRSQGLALTEAGRRLLPQARALLAHAEEVQVGAEAEQKLAGALTVGCFRTAAPFLVPGLLETFAATHPAVQLDFIEGPHDELETALMAGECEAAIIYHLGVSGGLVCEALYQTEPYAILAPEHPLADEEFLTLEMLAAHPVVMLDITPSRPYYESVFAHAGLEPDIRFSVSSYELLRSLVARNFGYGLLISRPHGDVSYEGRPLLARKLADDLAPIDVGLAWVAGAHRTPRAKAFAEHCRRVVPADIGRGLGAVRV